MSASGPSDPRLLLPEWLRDGDMPATAQPIADPVVAPPTETAPRVVEIESVAIQPIPVATTLTSPYSDRLSLDTRLDPGQLVSAADLPTWLGGLERVPSSAYTQSVLSPFPRATAAAAQIEEPEPYLGVDAPDDRAVDVEVSGWMLVAGAVGLLVLVLAAFKLYLS